MREPPCAASVCTDIEVYRIALGTGFTSDFKGERTLLVLIKSTSVASQKNDKPSNCAAFDYRGPFRLNRILTEC